MKPAIDLHGATFGQWKVLGRAPRRTKEEKARWWCRCSCGREQSLIGTNLTTGKSTRCKWCGMSARWENYRARSRLRADLPKEAHSVRSPE